MCLGSFPYQILVLIVVSFVIYSYKRMFDNSMANIKTLSGLLESPSVKSDYFVRSIEGYYKGRIIKHTYFMYDNNYGFMGPCVELRYPVNKSRLFCISYPRPTQNTFLKGNKVYYNRVRSPFKHTDWLWNNTGQLSKQEFTDILEELSRAAQIAEENLGHNS